MAIGSEQAAIRTVIAGALVENVSVVADEPMMVCRLGAQSKSVQSGKMALATASWTMA
jgi:hypothetical protein